MNEDTNEWFGVLYRRHARAGKLPPTDKEFMDFLIEEVGAEAWLEGGSLYVRYPQGTGFFQ